GQGSEEALGDGVVVGGRTADRDVDVGFSAAIAEEQRDVLLALVGVMDQAGRWPSAGDAISSASTTSSARRSSRIDQPTTRREKQSTTAARYSQPAPVGMYLMSATQSWFGADGAKSRPTSSAAGRTPGTRIVVL